jgi:hypothetical protein
MKKIIFLLLFCLPSLAFNNVHKFYVSTTDIEFIEEDETVQIISRVFIDDLELLLKTRYSETIKLGKNSETKNADKFIERYFTDKLQITINGKKILFKYLGNTYDDDLVKCFFKAVGVKSLENIEVKNEVLLDMFEDQQNVVHVTKNKTIKSLLLMNDRESDVLNFR